MKIVTSIVPDGIWVLPPAQVERLRREFPDLEIVDAPAVEDRLRELPDAEVAFLSQIAPAELAVAKSLRWIQSPAAGVGGLLFPEVRDSSIVVTNARGIHGEPIAEHVIGVSIVLLRQMQRAIRAQVEHSWTKDDLSLSQFRSLRGRCMGLVGLGSIGSTIAEKASALGMRVMAVRRHPEAPAPSSVSEVYPPERLGTLLAKADVVVIAAPLTPDTRGLIGAKELRLMKRDAILVNIARGKLVREEDLIAELRAGTIAGAALDVFEHEPLDSRSPLWDLPQVVITPHTSAFRQDYWDAAVDLFASNLRRYRSNQPLLNVVDKVAGY